ncbi:MAG: CBS domain-containing protein [Candidatus Eisenbacteria bacterium]|uniref:CBS domain-containing protein n=1 Tax=Eiseniibacteriota bacterium TaxID=2212470 RepID=A0A7Y2H395_UNCEI|nr:CBS domain-containing protein [Candidatus Eisenbacteria bacterium]
MGEHKVSQDLGSDQLRNFMRTLLRDLHALEKMIDTGMIETGIRRIGAEQELFLIDDAWRPAPLALPMLEKINDEHFTTELAQFNLEINLDPQVYGADCLSVMESQLNALLDKARQAARSLNGDIILTGILPTLRKADLSMENMTPISRYYALNEALTRLKDGPYEFRIRGTDELLLKHDSVMVESANASFQVHFQVDAQEFPKFYNIAQMVAGPVLAAASNSPLLFGRRLWRETRIALFEQAVDTRSSNDHIRERSSRVSFGRDWVRGSVLELFKEDIARFRSLLGDQFDEDPFSAIAEGKAPSLKALRLHNGTVYRWNRACYGITDGKPHLRIENRVLPSGPTPLDEVANAAFWFGLIAGMAKAYTDVSQLMDFDEVKYNFQAAARHGLEAQFSWLNEKSVPARTLIMRRLLPMARDGLAMGGIYEADINRYLGVIEERVHSATTGSRWLLQSLLEMKDSGSAGERLNALTAATIKNQGTDKPVAQWPMAKLEDAGGVKENFVKVEQYMSTDLFTVHEDELLDLVANLMEWEKIRHVPVEDHQNRLVGLVSYRSLLRLLARGMGENGKTLAVKDIMHKSPITVTPDTSTIEAVTMLQEHKIGCLPVVKDSRLVGIVTERDFMDIAANLLHEKLRS